MGIEASPQFRSDWRRPSAGRRATATAALLVAAGALVRGYPQRESVRNLGKVFRTYAAATGVPVMVLCLMNRAVFIVARHA